MTDSVIKVSSPDGIAFELHPAGAIVRSIAYLIDNTLQVIVFSIIAIIFLLFRIASTWSLLLAAFVITWFYMVIFELGLSGRSPGKLIIGLQVVLADGSPVTVPASLLRNLLRAFDVFLGIGLLVPLFTHGYRRLGDIVAGTLVVYTPDRLARMHGKLDLSGVVPRPPQRLLGPEAADVILSYARRRKNFGPELREELARAVIGAYLFETPAGEADRTALEIAAWYAGIRVARDAKPV